MLFCRAPNKSTHLGDSIPMLELTVRIAANIVVATNYFDDRNLKNTSGLEPITSYFLPLILGTGEGSVNRLRLFVERRKKGILKH